MKRDLTAHPGTWHLCSLWPHVLVFQLPDLSCVSVLVAAAALIATTLKAQSPALWVHAVGKMEKHKASCICNLALNMLVSLTSKKPTNLPGKYRFPSKTQWTSFKMRTSVLLKKCKTISTATYILA